MSYATGSIGDGGVFRPYDVIGVGQWRGPNEHFLSEQKYARIKIPHGLPRSCWISLGIVLDSHFDGFLSILKMPLMFPCLIRTFPFWPPFSRLRCFSSNDLTVFFPPHPFLLLPPTP